jgi:hypothetical protein
LHDPVFPLSWANVDRKSFIYRLIRAGLRHTAAIALGGHDAEEERPQETDVQKLRRKRHTEEG